MAKKKMLITGGAGFIGTHLAETFKDRYHVMLFDNFRRDSLRHIPDLTSNADVSVVRGDILDRNLIEKVIDGVDVVIHLAAIAGVSSYYNEATTTLRVNILGTLNILEAMRKSGTKKMIDFSTSEVYGVKAKNINEESVHAIGPVSQKRWVYAVSKLASEHFTLRYGEEFGLNCCCIRPFNIYGPRQIGEGAISNFSRSLYSNIPLRINGIGEDVRAWCYISDLVQAVELIMDRGINNESFNIGNPDWPVSTRELAELMIEIYGSGSIEHVDTEHAPIPFRSPDIRKARRLLGFNPIVDLRTGLTRTMEWFRTVQAS